MNTQAFMPLLGKLDMAGVTVAFVGYLVVFVALVLLYLVFNNVPKLIAYYNKRKLLKQGKVKHAQKATESVQGNVGAAISMALYLYFSEMHDEESNILTIKKVNKTYSPWNSKIYGMTNTSFK